MAVREWYEKAVEQFVTGINKRDHNLTNNANRDLCRMEERKDELIVEFGIPKDRSVYDFVRRDVLKLKYNFEKKT